MKRWVWLVVLLTLALSLSACGQRDKGAAATEAIGEWARFATSSSATLADMGTAGRTWAAETLSLQRFREGLQALL